MINKMQAIANTLSSCQHKFLFIVVGTNTVNKQCNLMAIFETKDHVNNCINKINNKIGNAMSIDVVKIKLEEDTAIYLMNNFYKPIVLDEFLILDNVYKHYKIDNSCNWIEINQ